MALKDIIGQEKALRILKGCVIKDRIPHALMFAGDEGIGKRLTALNYAKTLNCSGSDSNGLFASGSEEGSNDSQMKDTDSCDACSSCIKIDRGNHPDVFILEPEGDGDQIKVASVRQLQESLSYKPFEGKWKVAIIDNADRLNASAANAFLQTLEEPSSNSILILVTSRPEMIMPTIRSRCHRVNFSPLPLDKMRTLLEKELRKLDHEASGIVSILSGGRLGYALSEDLIMKRDRTFRSFTEMLGGPDGEAWQSRDEMDEWFEWALLWIRDIAVFKATNAKDLLINSDKISEIRRVSASSGLRDILNLARELYNIKGRLAVNLNKQLTFNYTSLLLRNKLGIKNVREQ
jgi:DNA polymerase-3 subunit delta'